MELIFNQDFQGLFIYMIILVLCWGDDGGLGEIRLTISFMKTWGGLKELKLSQSSNDLSCHQCAEGKLVLSTYLCIRLSLKHKPSFSVYLT